MTLPVKIYEEKILNDMDSFFGQKETFLYKSWFLFKK